MKRHISSVLAMVAFISLITPPAVGMSSDEEQERRSTPPVVEIKEKSHFCITTASREEIERKRERLLKKFRIDVIDLMLSGRIGCLGELLGHLNNPLNDPEKIDTIHRCYQLISGFKQHKEHSPLLSLTGVLGRMPRDVLKQIMDKNLTVSGAWRLPTVSKGSPTSKALRDLLVQTQPQGDVVANSREAFEGEGDKKRKARYRMVFGLLVGGFGYKKNQGEGVRLLNEWRDEQGFIAKKIYEKICRAIAGHEHGIFGYPQNHREADRLLQVWAGENIKMREWMDVKIQLNLVMHLLSKRQSQPPS